MRHFYGCIIAALTVLLWSASAAATKPSPPGASCADVRCAPRTSCLDTPVGPVCRNIQYSPNSPTCASTSCSAGSQCIETAQGPKCILRTPPPGYHGPNQPSYPAPPAHQQQSCAYGGIYTQGKLLCNPPPVKPPARPRPSWHPNGPDIVQPGPSPVICTMEYDPVCAEKPVVCVRSPCPPDRQTFGNRCQARAQSYTVLFKGVCN